MCLGFWPFKLYMKIFDIIGGFLPMANRICLQGLSMGRRCWAGKMRAQASPFLEALLPRLRQSACLRCSSARCCLQGRTHPDPSLSFSTIGDILAIESR